MIKLDLFKLDEQEFRPEISSIQLFSFASLILRTGGEFDHKFIKWGLKKSEVVFLVSSSKKILYGHSVTADGLAARLKTRLHIKFFMWSGKKNNALWFTALISFLHIHQWLCEILDYEEVKPRRNSDWLTFMTRD